MKLLRVLAIVPDDPWAAGVRSSGHPFTQADT